MKIKLIRFEPLAKLLNGSLLFGLEYGSPNNVHSWCYLTVSGNVIIATQLDTNTGQSISNSWCRAFVEMLKDLPRIKSIERPRWFEHYVYARHHGHRDHEAFPDQSLAEVLFIDRGPNTYCGEVEWKYLAHGTEVDAWKELTGDDVPDFAATGFESEMIARVHDQPYILTPPERVESVYIARCNICGAMATVDPEASAAQQQLWVHQHKPCPGYPVGKLLE